MLGRFAKKLKSFAGWLALFSWSASLTQCLQEAVEALCIFQQQNKRWGAGCIQKYLSTNQLKLLLL
jgi:hypothetical protein